METEEKRNTYSKVKRLFDASVIIPSVFVGASFLAIFMVPFVFYSTFIFDVDNRPDELKTTVVAAVIFGVIAIICCAVLFAINSKKYAIIKNLDIAKHGRVVIFDTLAASIGMIATAAFCFDVIFGMVTAEAGHPTPFIFIIPLFVVGIVFVPLLLPLITTQLKIRNYFIGQ